MAHIEGKVAGVTFRNEENGYTVLRVIGKETGQAASLVGVLPEVYEGQEFSAEGEWSKHPTYGRQFTAEAYVPMLPSGQQGLVKYLASPAFKGIGPVTAQLIVNALGDDALKYLGDAGRLSQIPGISASKAAVVADAWERQKAKRDILVWLYEHGVKPASAEKIFSFYGKSTKDKLMADPYCITRDIDGIGFLTADALGRSFGLLDAHPARVYAGTMHAIGELTSFGHCGVPQATLESTVADMLELGDEPALPAQIAEMVKDGALIKETSAGGVVCLFNPALYRQETSIADSIGARLSARPTWAPADDRIQPLTEEAEAALGVQLAPEQRQAIRNALTKSVSIVTGGPGTGKTTLVRVLSRILRKLGVVHHLAAPTGKAAIRLGSSTGAPASTIHRLFSLSAGKVTAVEGGLIVLDESSMLDVPVTSQVCRAVDQAQKEQVSTQSLLLIGDVDQLPSVGPGRVFGDMLNAGVVPAVRLSKVFRQGAGSKITEIAHAVNRGVYPDITHGELDRDALFIEAATPEDVRRELTRVLSKTLPDMDIPSSATQVLVPMRKGSLGANELNKYLKELLNPNPPKTITKFGRTFSVGDKVMQTKNNYKLDVFNGEIGVLVEIDDLSEVCRVQFLDRKVAYGFDALDGLVPAFATTVHKYQGSEERAIVLLLSTQHYPMLQRTLLFTGVTRAKEQLVLIGSKKAIALAIKQTASSMRHTRLKDLLVEQTQLAAWRAGNR